MNTNEETGLYQMVQETFRLARVNNMLLQHIGIAIAVDLKSAGGKQRIECAEVLTEYIGMLE